MEKELRKFIIFSCLYVLVSVSKGQDTACLNQLVPCLQYINSSHIPSSSCCTPLRSLINSDPGCLCSLLSGTTVTKQAGANANQALQLPKRCGEKVNAGLCKRKSQISSSCTCSDCPFMSKREKNNAGVNKSNCSVVDSST